MSKNYRRPLIEPGTKFGRLTVIEEQHGNRLANKTLTCICECGTIKNYVPSNVFRGTTTSCGCFAKEIHKKRTRKSPGQAVINKWKKNYKDGAIKRNLSYELSDNQFENLIKQNCHHCGSVPEYRNYFFNKEGNRTGNREISDEWAKQSGTYINGIDRLNNDIGYTIENSAACCSLCNKMKNKYTTNDFYNHINKIINFQKELKSEKS